MRDVLIGARLLAVHGAWRREGEVRNLIAGKPEDRTLLLGESANSGSSRDLH